MSKQLAKSRVALTIKIAIVLLLLFPVVRLFFPSLFIWPQFYQCEPATTDSDPLLVQICEFVREHTIRSKAGNPTHRTVKRMWEFTEPDGSIVIYVLLDCCGMGDLARIDKTTGEVIEYVPSSNVY